MPSEHNPYRKELDDMLHDLNILETIEQLSGRLRLRYEVVIIAYCISSIKPVLDLVRYLCHFWQGYWLIEVLCPTRHRIGHFGDTLPSQSVGSVLKKLNPTPESNKGPFLHTCSGSWLKIPQMLPNPQQFPALCMKSASLRTMMIGDLRLHLNHFSLISQLSQGFYW